MGKLLCWLGLHSWAYSYVTFSPSWPWPIDYRRQCQRCRMIRSKGHIMAEPAEWKETPVTVSGAEMSIPLPSGRTLVVPVEQVRLVPLSKAGPGTYIVKIRPGPDNRSLMRALRYARS